MKVKKTIFEIIMINFAKWVFILGAIGGMLYFFMPKYDYVDEHIRFNKVTGELEEKIDSGRGGRHHWIPYVE